MRFIDALIKAGPTICGWYDITNYLAMDPDGRVFGYEKKPTPNVIGWGIENRKNSTDGCGCRMDLDVDEIDYDWNTCIVSREQYESALAALKKVEWDGSFPLQVGTECEAYDRKYWYPAVVVGACDGFIFAWNYNHRITFAINNPEHLRPIRSEADKKRDEAIAKITDAICGDIPDTGMATAAKYAVRAYDAIAAGEIPHIHIE